MLKVNLFNPLGIFETHLDRIMREMMGLNVLGSLSVNAGGTTVDWNPFLPTGFHLQANGIGLTASGSKLTGGVITGYTLTDSSGTVLADFTGLHRSATKLQARIDTIAGMGLPFDQQAGLLEDWFDKGRDIRIDGSPGADVIEGNTGNDILKGKGGDDVFLASKGDDVMNAGAGHDSVDYGNLPALGPINGTASSLTIGTFTQTLGGFEDFTLTGKGDIFTGNNTAETIHAGGGADIVHGSGGPDLIEGFAGNDSLYGQGGDDFMFGGDGIDSIIGSAGNDDLFGGPGRDTISGNLGDDFISGGLASDFISAGFGNDSVIGGNGQDFIFAGPGADSIRGDGGNDTISGGPDNDRIDGNAGEDDILGGSGHDLLRGQSGNDTLGGGSGNDTIKGGGGVDQISGDEGDDELYGGLSADRFFFRPFTVQGNDTIFDFSGDKITVLGETVANVTVTTGLDALITYSGGSILLPGIDGSLLAVTQVGGSVEIT